MESNYICGACSAELEFLEVTLDQPMGYLCVRWHCPECDKTYSNEIRECDCPLTE